MNKQNDTDLTGIIASILVVFCVGILLFGVYTVLLAAS
jgi:hypothetical protein